MVPTQTYVPLSRLCLPQCTAVPGPVYRSSASGTSGHCVSPPRIGECPMGRGLWYRTMSGFPHPSSEVCLVPQFPSMCCLLI